MSELQESEPPLVLEPPGLPKVYDPVPIPSFGEDHSETVSTFSTALSDSI